MKKLAIIIGLMAVGCAGTSNDVKPIRYPWLCQVGRSCTTLGYEIQTDEGQYVAQQAQELCPQGVKSITPDVNHRKTLVVCK